MADKPINPPTITASSRVEPWEMDEYCGKRNITPEVVVKVTYQHGDARSALDALRQAVQEVTNQIESTK